MKMRRIWAELALELFSAGHSGVVVTGCADESAARDTIRAVEAHSAASVRSF